MNPTDYVWLSLTQRQCDVLIARLATHQAQGPEEAEIIRTVGRQVAAAQCPSCPFSESPWADIESIPARLS